MPGPRRLYAVAAGAALVAAPAGRRPPRRRRPPRHRRRSPSMGNLQSELGCPADWRARLHRRPSCRAVGDTDAVRARPSTCRPAAVRVQGAAQRLLDRELRRRHVRPARRQHPAGARPAPRELRFTYDHATHRVTVGPAAAGGRADGRRPRRSPATACARTSPARTSTSSWPTGSRTATRRTTRRPSTGDPARPRLRPDRARASTTAVTSRASSSGSTTSRAWARRRSG